MLLKADAAGDTSASESTVTGGVIRQQVELTRNAAVTAGQAETVLDVMEQESKLRYVSAEREREREREREYNSLSV